MPAPPLSAGAAHETSALVLPPTAVAAVGVPGVVAGVTELDAIDGTPVPTPLVAVTVNVYEVPFVNPVTTHVRAPVVVQNLPPVELVAV
jgi:hypothetical protein